MKILKNIIPYIVIVVVVVLIRSFLVTPASVNGDSMEPTLSNKNIILINKADKNYKRFDIVVFNFEGERLIKRVIGLPGEHVKYKYGNLYVNDILIKEDFKHGLTEDYDIKAFKYDVIPDDYYFVVGDNREISKDSRIIGFISKKTIIGSTNIVIFPFNKFGAINK